MNIYVGNLAYTTSDQELRDAFFTDTDKWKEQIVERAIEFTDKAYKGLAA